MNRALLPFSHLYPATSRRLPPTVRTAFHGHNTLPIRLRRLTEYARSGKSQKWKILFMDFI